MTAGTLIIGLGLISGSQIRHLWQLYIIFAFIGCGLMCASIIPCSLIISNWFVSRRGVAMSAAFVGTSIGGMVMSPIANWIIINHGWRVAFAFSGLTILVTVIPTILFLIRTRPSEMGLEPYRLDTENSKTSADNWGVTVKEAFSLPVFWQIAAIMLLVGIVTGGVGNNCPAYLNDLGHSSTKAAFAWSFVMGVMILGKVVFGPLADAWGAGRVMAIACAMFAGGIAIMLFARPFSVVLIFAAIYGFASGAPLVLNPLLVSGSMGTRNFGALYGILNIMGSVGGAIGPVGAGIFFDRQGTYLPVFYLFIGLMLIGVMVAMSINPVHHEN
jgi:MFS family permease